jgi:hypothetical protein
MHNDTTPPSKASARGGGGGGRRAMSPWLSFLPTPSLVEDQALIWSVITFTLQNQSGNII